MHTLLPTIRRWQQEDRPIALATLVRVYGSAPQPLGAGMIVAGDGAMEGSVSGGCVEGAVVQEGMAVLKSGVPRLITYGIADELAQSVGLACGGTIEVYVEPLSGPVWADVLAQLDAGRAVALVRNLTTHDRFLAGRDDLAELAGEDVARRLTQPGADLFVQRFLPPERLVIVGAVHTARPLVTFAKELGFHTIVVDARSAFATPERFGHAHELRVGWPGDILAELALDESSYVVFLSHDEKLDNPALAVALDRPVAYVGALGSRRTHAKRVDALTELGVPAEQIARIHAPIGLNLGGRRPEEIAVAIMAQIVQIRNGVRDGV